MDELELLKKDWQKQEQSIPQLSYSEIYKMILKRSSSIVKWIFIISILEFVLWASIDIIFRINGSYKEVENTGMEPFFIISTICSYTILIYFMIRFYRNYKKIKTTDSAKILMANILKTRKSVKEYVVVNLSFLVLFSFLTIGYIALFTNDYQVDANTMHISVWFMIMISILAILGFIALLALFYRLVYGFLTRKLKVNYKELERLEM